jgi:5-methylcytosine-specific restriction endonuclease McrA
MTDRALLLLEDKLDAIERLIDRAKAGGCVDCGKSRDTGAGKGKTDQLEFHHLDPATKAFSVGLGNERRRRSVAEFQAEIAKCVALCKSCHTRRHTYEKWAQRREERERP